MGVWGVIGGGSGALCGVGGVMGGSVWVWGCYEGAQCGAGGADGGARCGAGGPLIPLLPPSPPPGYSLHGPGGEVEMVEEY